MSESISMQTSQIQDYSQLFKALGDQTRLKITGLLKGRELCVCDFMEVLDLAQSTASRHLSYLKNSGWVTGRREGKWMYYRLHPQIDQKSAQAAILNEISSLPEMQAIYKTLEVYLEQKDKSMRCP